MSFRVVTIKSRCKLEFSLNYMVCRGENESRIYIDEISTLIIQNTGVTLTAALISVLLSKKVKIIFCDSQHNPQGELIPYYGTYDSYGKITNQIKWKKTTQDEIWKIIIMKKIDNQRKNLLLTEHNDAAIKLSEYMNQITPGDTTNREGHSAKVYFNALFGLGFSRGNDDFIENKYLNYGYAILLSLINREIKIAGYLTELGIHHIGNENPFNISCDFIEPLRPYVDLKVIKKDINESNYKNKFIEMLSEKVFFNNNEMYLDNAIHLYVQSIFIALRDNDTSKISFVEYECI